MRQRKSWGRVWAPRTGSHLTQGPGKENDEAPVWDEVRCETEAGPEDTVKKT